MNNFNLVSKSAKLKLSATLALVLISGSIYAGGGIWNKDSKNNKSDKQSNMFSKKQDSKNKFGKSGKSGSKKGGGKHGGKDCKPTNSVPLDGGLSILLLGAAAFGVKKLRDNN